MKQVVQAAARKHLLIDAIPEADEIRTAIRMAVDEIQLLRSLLRLAVSRERQDEARRRTKRTAQDSNR